jgi:hypothetical protein
MSQHVVLHIVLSFQLMKSVKPIVLLWALLFASLGGCFGPLMAGMRSMNCCESMPCHPMSQSHNCCTPELPGSANHLQQTASVTAPPVAFAVLATLPQLSEAPVGLAVTHRPSGMHCDSPPGDLYTIHHSFLI